MEFALDLGIEDEVETIEEVDSKIYEIVSEKSLIPRVGSFLGLDISSASSGICVYSDGKKLTANITLTVPENAEFREVKLRRELKEKLGQLIKGETFDLIILEDAFQGINPETTRLLYALNTAIDEMILDGECYCKHFKRVSNQSWKSWLYTVDTEKKFKGLNDKIRIQKCLEMLGVHEEGEGFQDRLDSCGMLLGYFLCRSDVEEKEQQKKKRKVSLSDVSYGYEEDMEIAILKAREDNPDIGRYVVSEKKWSKSKILEYLTNNPEYVYVTDNLVKLGNLASELGLQYLDNGGYFAFWIRDSRLDKYLKES